LSVAHQPGVGVRWRRGGERVWVEEVITGLGLGLGLWSRWDLGFSDCVSFMDLDSD